MRHAADTAQKTARPGNACNRQRETDSRRHARGREHFEMQLETHGIAAFRVRRAAGSGQAAACAKHCTRQPVRNGTDATHKMQHTTGAAACSRLTRNRQRAAGNAMHGMREETTGSRTLAHLGGCAGFGITAGRTLDKPQGAQVFSGDASDVAARRLRISLACAHRWPTDVDRLRLGIRTRLGAREVHAVGSAAPRTATASFTRSDEASGSFYNASPQRTRGSSFAPLFPMRYHACSVLPVACLLQKSDLAPGTVCLREWRLRRLAILIRPRVLDVNCVFLSGAMHCMRM
jgi:hypothetical protein